MKNCEVLNDISYMSYKVSSASRREWSPTSSHLRNWLIFCIVLNCFKSNYESGCCAYRIGNLWPVESSHWFLFIFSSFEFMAIRKIITSKLDSLFDPSKEPYGFKTSSSAEQIQHSVGSISRCIEKFNDIFFIVKPRQVLSWRLLSFPFLYMLRQWRTVW